MKKYFIFMILLFIPFISISAKTTTEATTTKTREIVSLENCNDISQIWINKNNKTFRIGLLAYDSGDTELNQTIQNNICSMLKEANKIEIEYDDNNNQKDKYNRDLVWLYVDDKLIQKELIKDGLGMVNYVLDDYYYIDDLCILEANAIKNKKGIWQFGVEEKHCDSGIILEKQEKERENNNIVKKIDTTSIIIISVVLISILILTIIFISGVKHEKK